MCFQLSLQLFLHLSHSSVGGTKLRCDICNKQNKTADVCLRVFATYGYMRFWKLYTAIIVDDIGLRGQESKQDAEVCLD